MPSIDAEISIRRAPGRLRVLLALVELGEANVSQLAAATGIRESRVHAILHGRRPSYAIDLSLLALGLAASRPSGRALAYAPSAIGRRKAAAVRRALTRPGFDVRLRVAVRPRGRPRGRSAG